MLPKMPSLKYILQNETHAPLQNNTNIAFTTRKQFQVAGY